MSHSIRGNIFWKKQNGNEVSVKIHHISRMTEFENIHAQFTALAAYIWLRKWKQQNETQPDLLDYLNI